MHGSGFCLSGTDTEKAGFELLVARYPFLEEFATGRLAGHLGAAAVYRFRPAKLTLIDNGRGFGFKQTLDLAARTAAATVPD